MNSFETKRLKLKVLFVAVAGLLLVVLPVLTAHVARIGKILLSPAQMLYAVLSLEIVLAIYLWGVGNWSRFEPPQNLSGSTSQRPGNPPLRPTPATPPIQERVAPPMESGGH